MAERKKEGFRSLRQPKSFFLTWKQAAAALQKYSSANAGQLLNDALFQQVGNSALKAVGYDGLSGAGGECLEIASMDAIRAGGPEQACVAFSPEWVGWPAVDALNRQLADPGSTPVGRGISFQIIEEDARSPGVRRLPGASRLQGRSVRSTATMRSSEA
ncbi:hypothetical protein ACG83_29925 [Frankia sp. R43]|uniref:hypothetical protein n=1 Tax=Frankia sp. R43 TaxID=269536 RepID=UPI0006CA267F|nr:hypothetical protein [Frankia sp. R43]KPM52537.1 hypothetical protein ACG83_29925 [Frankia sp. R43]